MNQKRRKMMKNLYLLRGIPGCGKSTFLSKYKLDGFVISSDAIRLMFCPPILDKNSGNYIINQKNDKKVWDFLHSLVADRIEKGYTTIVDATHCSESSISWYKNLCQNNHANLTVVEFNEYSDAWLEKILEQNRNRQKKFAIVPDEVLKRMFDNAKNSKLGSWCQVISKEEFAEILENSVGSY